MKLSCPCGSGLYQDDSAPIHGAKGVTEWLLKAVTYHIIFILRQSKPIRKAEGDLGVTSPPSKHQMMEYIMEGLRSSHL